MMNILNYENCSNCEIICVVISQQKLSEISFRRYYTGDKNMAQGWGEPRRRPHWAQSSYSDSVLIGKVCLKIQINYPISQHKAMWKMAVQIPLPVHSSHAIRRECAQKYDKVYHITTGWNTALSAKQEGVWGIMSVFRHYSMSKPQRQCAAKDSSIITTFLWLSSQTEINEKLQIQEEAFNARIEKLKKAWGPSTRRTMLNFTETNTTSQNNRPYLAAELLHFVGRGKPRSTFYYLK